MIKNFGYVAEEWWTSLQPKPGGYPGDRASLAALRKATDVFEIVGVQAAHTLVRRAEAASNFEVDRVLTAASVLAHVRKNDLAARNERRITIAQRLAEGGKRPKVSILRFKLLMRAAEAPEIIREFRRLVQMLDGTANVADLAQSVADWSSEWRGEPRRYQWQLDYHGALEREAA